MGKECKFCVTAAHGVMHDARTDNTELIVESLCLNPDTKYIRCRKSFDVETCPHFTEKKRIYYAHHRYKYGTKVEKYELNLIKKYHPDADIFNPATDLDIYDGITEEEAMEQCIKQVKASDIVVFSSMDGMIGKGVFEELEAAKEAGIFTLYLHHDALINQEYFNYRKYALSTDDRVYGVVNLYSFL